MVLMKTCRFCATEFVPKWDKPGRIDVCYDPDCQRKDRRQMPEPPKLGGNMIWFHKTAPGLEIKPIAEAREFARKTRRFGAGVMISLTSCKTPFGEED